MSQKNFLEALRRYNEKLSEMPPEEYKRRKQINENISDMMILCDCIFYDGYKIPETFYCNCLVNILEKKYYCKRCKEELYCLNYNGNFPLCKNCRIKKNKN
jgi:hypothetical protein